MRLEYGLIFWNYTCPLGKQFSTRVFECIGSETRLSRTDYKCYHLLWCPQTNYLTFLCLSFLICNLGTHTHTQKSLSRARLFATPWIVAHQAPPPMEFSRQEYWSGLTFPSPGDLPDLGIEPGSPALRADAVVVLQ